MQIPTGEKPICGNNLHNCVYGCEIKEMSPIYIWKNVCDQCLSCMSFPQVYLWNTLINFTRERGGSVVECRTPEREVRGSRPTAAVLCPWARHFTPRKYWLITQEAMAPSRYDWKIVDWDVKPQHNQPTNFTKFLQHVSHVWLLFTSKNDVKLFSYQSYEGGAMYSWVSIVHT